MNHARVLRLLSAIGALLERKSTTHLFAFLSKWCIHCCHLHILIGILKCVKAAILCVILHIL